MAANSSEYVPLNVNVPEKNKKFNVFDWNNAKLQEWVKIATKNQDFHYRDNSLTECFVYNDHEFDAIQLRLCMVFFGLKVKIVKNGTNESGKISCNVVYVSVAFSDEKSGFNGSENAVIVITANNTMKFMDAGGRMYENWEDYLRSNKFPQGVMVYPENGSYTPPNNNKVNLIAQETPSCKISAQVKDVLDKVVMTTGIVLTGVALIVAAPVGILSAATLTMVSTGSFYIGLACTAYSVSTGLYDKLGHDETAWTEAFLIATTALSGLTMWYSSRWTATMAKHAANLDLWDDVVKGISTTQRLAFASLNLLKLGLSSFSVLSAIYSLCMKKKNERTWGDWANLCISVFFFTNAVTKPIFLQQVFETEQTRFLENAFGTQMTNKGSEEAFKKTMKEANTTQKKTYLSRNLSRIDNIDEHFCRVHEFGTVISYTENGMIIDNVITISPEAYNQMGKEVLQMRLNYIKLLPTAESRVDAIKQIENDYKTTPRFKELAQKYVNDTLTPQEKTEFKESMKEMPKHRKDHLFRETAKYRNIEAYRETMNQKEMELNGGKNLEQLKQDKINISQQLNSNQISKEEYNAKVLTVDENIKKAETFRKLRSSLDECIKDGKSFDEIERSFNGGKTEAECHEQIRKLKDDFGKITNKENCQKTITKLEQKLETLKENPNTNKKSMKNLRIRIREEHNRLAKAEELGNDVEKMNSKRMEYNANLSKAENDLLKAQSNAPTLETFKNSIMNDPKMHQTLVENKSLMKDMDTFTNSRNERFCTHQQTDFVKSDIENLFGVPNYCDAQVNGQFIFKDLDINASDRMYRKLNELGGFKSRIVQVAQKLTDDPNFKMKADSPREFCNVLEAIQQSAESQVDQKAFLKNALVPNSEAYSTILNQSNKQLQEALNANYSNGQLQYTSLNSAATHSWKHKAEFGANTTTSEYLAEHSQTVINNDNRLGETYSQDGKHIRANYGVHYRNRYSFGVTTTNVATGESKIATVHTKAISNEADLSRLQNMQKPWFTNFFSD
uniref:DUF4781 domain-containing protein n=1 Tax=Panagrolaimus sp. ES5 TaxID=591445 RepID=A0AC34F042_9BILA